MTRIENRDEKCAMIQRLIDGGQGVCESCREIGISEKTYYRWRKANSDKVEIAAVS